MASAASAAARSDSAGVAIKRTVCPCQIGFAGFGDSNAPLRSAAITGAGRSIPKRAKMAKASAQVVSSGTVGPLAITPTSSPGTSLIANVTSVAGAQASPSRPPLMALRCLRTQFMSPIPAPLSSKAWFSCCLSAKLSPAAGAVNRAEPPPDIKQMTKSPAWACSAIASMRCAAATPAASGTGWAASKI